MNIPIQRYAGRVPVPAAVYRAPFPGAAGVPAATLGIGHLEAGVELTPDQLAAHPAVAALMAQSAEAAATAAVRAMNTVDPGTRPGGTAVAAPNVNLGRATLNIGRAITAMRTRSWQGAELERDFSQAVRSLYDHDADPNSFVVPLTPLAYADAITQAAIRTEYSPALREYAVRAANEGSTTAGGALVPAQYMQNDFVLSLQTATAFYNTPGHDEIPVTSPLVYFPRETVLSAGSAYAEAGTISATDPTFGQQAITVKKIASLNQFSNELLADSTPAYEAYLSRALGRRLALVRDLQSLEGDGTGANVLGLGSYSGLTAGYTPGTNGDFWGTSGASPGTDFPLSLIAKARNAGWEPNAWIMHPQIWSTLLTVKDSTGRYILESAGGVFGAPVVVPNVGSLPTQAQYTTPPWKATLFGIPVFLTAQIPVTETYGDETATSHVYLGDFNFARSLIRQAAEIAISDQILFTTDQTAVRVSMRFAIVLTIPGAFIKQMGVNTVAET